MSEIVAFDVDGTLLNYGGGAPVVNERLIRALQQTRDLSVIGIVTNQGGIPFAVAQARNGTPVTFPTAKQFIWRLDHLVKVLLSLRVRVVAVRVCVNHPKAALDDRQTAARQIRDKLKRAPYDWHIYTAPDMRKPRGAMLLSLARKGIYYGDSDEDRAAAAAAGWQFVQVERFHG